MEEEEEEERESTYIIIITMARQCHGKTSFFSFHFSNLIKSCNAMMIPDGAIIVMTTIDNDKLELIIVIAGVTLVVRKLRVIKMIN